MILVRAGKRIIARAGKRIITLKLTRCGRDRRQRWRASVDWSMGGDKINTSSSYSLNFYWHVPMSRTTSSCHIAITGQEHLVEAHVHVYLEKPPGSWTFVTGAKHQQTSLPYSKIAIHTHIYIYNHAFAVTEYEILFDMLDDNVGDFLKTPKRKNGTLGHKMGVLRTYFHFDSKSA